MSDTSDEELRELIAALRDAMQRISPTPLPPLPPPASQEELETAEAAIGYPLPNELRALYSIARAGRIGIFNVIPIDTIADTTEHELLSLDQDMEWRPGRDSTHWDGEIPQGDLLVISWDPPDTIFYECNGPLARRLVHFGFSGIDDVWGRLARSLTDCLRWQLAAFELGAFEIHPSLDNHDIIISDSDHIDFDQMITNLRPDLAAAGGTPAYFNIYDPPPGWRSPAR